MTGEMIKDTDPERATNSPMRHRYRQLGEEEKERVAALKDREERMLDLLAECGQSRELSIARTKVEEAVMWAVKHVTA